MNLRLASANEDRIADSFTSVADEINKVCLSEFLRNVSTNEDNRKTIRRANLTTEEMYSFICKKVTATAAVLYNCVIVLHYNVHVASDCDCPPL